MERRLGRGLGSLLGQTDEAPQAGSRKEQFGAGADEGPAGIGELIAIDSIRRNPDQPRKVFESEALEELRDSIARHGVLQPICVRRVGRGFEIISGERRWRAARTAGLERIPAVVRDEVADDVSLELALIENVQREDLDPIEKAEGYRSLMDRVGLTQEQIAERLGLKRSSVANQLRLLELPTEGQDAVRKGLITMGHAKALLSIRGAASLRKALQEIVRKDLSVREAERLAKAGVARPAAASAKAESSTGSSPAWVGDLERRLRAALGVKVTLRSGKGYRGSIQLDFAGREELDRLCDQLAPKDTL